MTTIEQRDATRTRLRSHLRKQRSALSAQALDEAAQAVSTYLIDTLSGCRRVAGYLAIGGEVPLSLTLSRLRADGIVTAVPVVTGDAMRFLVIDDDTAMRRNRFGIDEPTDDAPELAALQLDAVLVPLVAFDAAGNRLGMGGGFYDRCFATLAARRDRGESTPRLIGVAHAFQQLPRLEPEAWDVPLDQVVTEVGTASARNNR